MRHTSYWAQMSRTLPLLVLVVAALTATDGSGQTWRGLVVAPERRCSPYRADDYSYPQSVEASIVRELGGIYSPYTGQRFASTGETDIEHMVARSEAHDSGLCAADPETRRAFARDLLNLTLASPGVNRGFKGASDAAEWMPQRNRCWFSARVLAVRQRWGLTIDAREAETLETVLAGCATTELDASGGDWADAAQGSVASGDALRLWDDNGSGTITCAEARRHGIAPVPRDHPAYPFMRDGDGDGVVCEQAGETAGASQPPAQQAGLPDALRLWDDNGNGMITCAEARRHGIAPVRRGHPAYPFMRDADGDGVVCERNEG